MDTEELEKYLRDSTLGYSFKANWLVHGVQQSPCPNCPFKKEDPPTPFLIKDQKCFERCPYNIIVWILNEDQEVLYEKFRPDEKKGLDLEMAINAHKVILVKNTIGRVPGLSSLPLFLE